MNNVTAYRPSAFGVPARQMQSQMNNSVANAMAMGDPRLNVKQYDRAGISRGAAQWNQAGIDAASRIADGVADAYGQDLQARQFNTNLQRQGAYDRENNALALGALNQQNAYADQLAAMQRQQVAASLLSGLFNQ